MTTVRVAIVGDFDHGRPSHWATEAALFHSAARVGVAVEPHWIATPSVPSANAAQPLARFAGLCAAPGSPFASAPGMLSAIIRPVMCAMPGRSPSGPALFGEGTARPVPGSLFAKLCSGCERGEYFCSMEANGAYLERWQSAGLRIAARGDQDEMRALELPDRRLFVATLFQPQLSSSHERPHPLIDGYLRACMAGQRAEP